MDATPRRRRSETPSLTPIRRSLRLQEKMRRKSSMELTIFTPSPIKQEVISPHSKDGINNGKTLAQKRKESEYMMDTSYQYEYIESKLPSLNGNTTHTHQLKNSEFARLGQNEQVGLYSELARIHQEHCFTEYNESALLGQGRLSKLGEFSDEECSTDIDINDAPHSVKTEETDVTDERTIVHEKDTRSTTGSNSNGFNIRALAEYSDDGLSDGVIPDDIIQYATTMEADLLTDDEEHENGLQTEASNLYEKSVTTDYHHNNGDIMNTDVSAHNHPADVGIAHDNGLLNVPKRRRRRMDSDRSGSISATKLKKRAIKTLTSSPVNRMNELRSQQRGRRPGERRFPGESRCMKSAFFLSILAMFGALLGLYAVPPGYEEDDLVNNHQEPAIDLTQTSQHDTALDEILVTAPDELLVTGPNASETHLIDAINKLQKVYPEQRSRLWTTLTVPLQRSLIEPDPKQPAVVIIGHHHKCETMVNYILRNISDATTEQFRGNHYLTMDGYDMLSLNDSRTYLEEQLTNNYESNNKIAILYNIHIVPAEAAKSLHYMYDTENAPYKDVALLATISLDDTANITATSVEDALVESWKTIGGDTIAALLSRIGNNIAVIISENC